MPRDSKVKMPSSSAGVLSFYDEERSTIMLKPQHVVIMCVLVIVSVLILTYYFR
ncbi:preprotein translocase subunit Sec61beta [Candidatus Woesearchaeota archaeon]|nr:preprotein translocase subunit Sec61beta [Candidatus Woesearchaeota archaeon]